MRIIQITIILSILTLATHAQDSNEACEDEFLASDLVLKPFKTDQCTGYREGPRSNPEEWAHCCVEHDLFMWAGGTRKDRQDADKRLRECVKATGYNVDAFLIYAGVKVGSASPIKIRSKKWNNGWIQKRKKSPLTSHEIVHIEASLKKHATFLSEEYIKKIVEELKNRSLQKL